MSRWYLDTSAALKLMIEQRQSGALARLIDAEQPELVACLLLETELRRTVHRIGGLSQEAVSVFLDGVSLFEVPPSLFREAGLLPGEWLRSLDALHVAAGIRLGVDRVLTYDARLADAARGVGLPVSAPS